MPLYEFFCPCCYKRDTQSAPISMGPIEPMYCSGRYAPHVPVQMRRDYSGIQIVANPVPWREENRVGAEERKRINSDLERYAKQAESYSETCTPSGKKLDGMGECYAEASRLLSEGSQLEVNGVADGKFVGLTPQQAAARGID